MTLDSHRLYNHRSNSRGMKISRQFSPAKSHRKFLSRGARTANGLYPLKSRPFSMRVGVFDRELT